MFGGYLLGSYILDYDEDDVEDSIPNLSVLITISERFRNIVINKIIDLLSDLESTTFLLYGTFACVI